jgi:hypothetical protein
MAIIDLLVVEMELTRNAIFAANPELATEYLLELPQPSVSACLADALLVSMASVDAAIRSYRSYVVDHEECRLGGRDFVDDSIVI